MRALPSRSTGSAINAACEQDSAGFVLAAPAAALLARIAPQETAEVLTKCRVMLIDGPLDLPLTAGRHDATIEVITVNAPQIARQISADVVSGEALSRHEQTTFRAEARINAVLQPQFG